MGERKRRRKENQGKRKRRKEEGSCWVWGETDPKLLQAFLFTAQCAVLLQCFRGLVAALSELLPVFSHLWMVVCLGSVSSFYIQHVGSGCLSVPGSLSATLSNSQVSSWKVFACCFCSILETPWMDVCPVWMESSQHLSLWHVNSSLFPIIFFLIELGGVFLETSPCPA